MRSYRSELSPQKQVAQKPASSTLIDAHQRHGNDALGAAFQGLEFGSAGLAAEVLQMEAAGIYFGESSSLPNSLVNRAMEICRSDDGGNLNPSPMLLRVLLEGGHSLPPALRARMEAVLGADFSSVRIHLGAASEQAAESINAAAFATGEHIYFGKGSFQPGSIKTDELLAHELTHVLQAREGRVPKATGTGLQVSSPNDAHEQEAVATAKTAVEAFKNLEMDEGAAEFSSSDLSSNDSSPGTASTDGLLSASPKNETADLHIDPPKPGIDKPGYIDSDDGANVRTAPKESGGQLLTLLPAATAVYVTGTHPDTDEWPYITARTSDGIVRGYVQDFRVTTDLPEPNAKLYSIKSGDTVEGIAVQEFKASIQPGHDLRYYENVLLDVNKRAERSGIKGSYQDPDLLGGGANNIQLEAGRRIWLVSPAFAMTQTDVVPDGSLSNGSYAEIKAFAQHIQDLNTSMRNSIFYLDDEALEVVGMIKENWAEILGVVAIFLVAQEIAAALSATGVGAILATLIEGILAIWAGKMAIDAGKAALEAGKQWWSLAWGANGDPQKLAAASKAFIHMLALLGMTALAVVGVVGSGVRAFGYAKTGFAPKPIEPLVEKTTPVPSSFPKSWKPFDPQYNEAFFRELEEFRGPGKLEPSGFGREGKIFENADKTLALKRWNLKAISLMKSSVNDLKMISSEVQANPELAKLLAAPKVYEVVNDWILRDYFGDAVPLRSVSSAASLQTTTKLIELLEQMKTEGTLSPTLLEVLKKISRPEPSENLMWSSELGKILIVDMK